MLASEKEQLHQDVVMFAENCASHRSGLLPVLQHIQREYRHIPAEAMQEVADAFNIHPAEVYGVVSFYSFLSTKRKGKFIVRLCKTISCDLAGKNGIATQLENDLGVKFGQTTSDGKFTLEYTHCLGMCDQGPAMLVNDEVYSKVTLESVTDIIESYIRKSGAHVTQGGAE